MEFIKTGEIKTEKPFNELFEINKDVLQAITDHMKNGYDLAFPVILWKNTVIDGHTRLIAAKNNNIEEIPVEQKEFKDEQEALEYAIHNQRNRRNLTEYEILQCVRVLDKKKQQGERIDLQEHNLDSNYVKGESRNKTAETIGVGRSKISDARTVLDSDNEEAIIRVKDGEPISKVAKDIRQENKFKKEVSLSTFNQVNENIEWARWSWNPVTGCKHNCDYCYARDIANRFYDEKFEPTFRPERLTAPINTKLPDNPTLRDKGVFVCSMADLFGDWVPEEWIIQILNVCKENPQWNFIFLTKNPKRLLDFEFPNNAWVGTTVDEQNRMVIAVKVFERLKVKVKFISCEPLMEEIKFSSLSMVDWLIIGGRSKSTRMEAGQPEWRWVESLVNQARKDKVAVYFKTNLLVRPKEYPKD